MNDLVIPAREVFRHFPAALVAGFYAVALVAMGVFAYGCWLRIAKYRAGRPLQHPLATGHRILRSARLIASHATLRKRDAYAGWAHALVFWGFLALLAGTTIVVVDQDILGPLAPGLQFWNGAFYSWNSLILDLMGAGMLAGLAAMAVRRWCFKLPKLDYARADGQGAQARRLAYVRDDWIFLGGLLLIGITGFLVEALRIGADRPPFELWSVLGWQLANGLDAFGLSATAAGTLHAYIWCLHALLALAFIAYIPYSKAIHVLAGMASLFLQDPLAGKRLAPVANDAAAAGYRALEDFSWKELLALDACTKCGRCHASCPARAGGWPLSPRDLILDLREHAELALGARSWYQRSKARTGDRIVAGTVVKPGALWACTSCLACVEACPVAIEHVPLIVQLRRSLVEEGALDSNLQGVLEKLARCGNSFGEPQRSRGKWTEGLPFRIKDARKEPVEFLWFVGDYASYEPSVQPVTRAAARVFHAAGLDFGILYEAENNAGNDIRRAGEEGLYQLLVEKNRAALAGARFRQIVTTDPHSYSTLKFEYPEFGATYRVRHLAEVIWEAVGTGRLALKKIPQATVTYHDPCHLSRYTQVTEAPRALLAALGLRLVEMERNGANSFCCGAGGGRIWMTDAGKAERPSVQRIREALQIPGLIYFVVACPKYRSMFRDAAKSVAGGPEVKDLIELIAEALEHGPVAAASRESEKCA